MFNKNTSISILIVLAILCLQTSGKTAEEWKSRSVYQIITDRFARSDGDTTQCESLGNYCGGTYKGIQNNLDYIQGMGFDAIWISPIVANTPGGYHGYWASNLYEVNLEFGTAEELKELIQTCHDRDIWVMVDIVANHMGYVENWNYSSLVPFSQDAHYHPYVDCATVDQKDEKAFETCWLSGLPDLDQNDPFVRETFMTWIADLVQTYNFDALRIDTVPHVAREFWADFGKASGVFTVGEVLNLELHYLASYQGPLESILNYALYSALRDSLQHGKSMNVIQDYYTDAYKTWPDITLLGNFINNHDNPRFLSNSTNVQAFKTGIAFTICSVGIPMVYYGDEQAFKGGMDPANREVLWTDMNADSEIYGFIKKINNFRKDSGFHVFEQVQRQSDDSFYSFTRDKHFFAFTNSQEQVTRMVNSHSYSEGTILCNVLNEKDCVKVENNEFPVVLVNGEVKIFTPSENSQEKEKESPKTSQKEGLKTFISTGSIDA